MGDKVLVVDDSPAFLTLVNRLLTGQGFEVVQARDGQEGLRTFFSTRPDLVVTDVVMPKLDGCQLCQRIREMSDVPVIMVTGKQQAEGDVVRGLDCGADEYPFKPVGDGELVARVKATLRRAELAGTERKEVAFADGYLAIDVAARRVLVGGERIRLTPREFSVLVLLLQNAGSVLTHRQILEKVWGWEYGDEIDYVRIYVAHVRQKIEPDPGHPRYILTEPGMGYLFQTSTPAR